MEYLTVKFLGEEFQVSETIKEYLNYEKIFTPLAENVIKSVMQVINHHSLFSPSEIIEKCLNNDMTKYNKIIDDFADVLIKRLINFEIYDITADDITNNGEHKQLILNLTAKTTLKCLQEGQTFLQMKQMGMATAYNYASTNIKGTGFGIITNSFSSLAIYSAIESYAILSQAKKADAEYNKAVEKITKRVSDNFERMCKDVLVNEHYPALFAIFSDFINHSISTFYAQLTLRNKFDFESISEYNMIKASDMLENIDSASDKKGFLKQVFLKCPFNPDVYEKCFDFGLMDVETFETAKLFDAADGFVDKIEWQCKNNSDNYKRFKPSLELYMSCNNLNQHEALAAIFGTMISDSQDKYSSISKAITDNGYLPLWVKINITTSAKKLCGYSKTDIQEIVKSKINNIVPNQKHDVISHYNLLPEFGLPNYKEGATIVELNEDLSNKLVESIMCYVDEVKKRRDELIAEYHILKDEYDSLKASIETKRSELLQELDALKSDRKALNIFAFSKKKELDLQIDTISQKISKLKDSNELSNLKEKCDSKMQEIDKL